MPFGVDVAAFRPTGAPPDVDVISVGADPHRDFELLLTVARAMPETSFLAVTTADRARSLAGRSSNVAVETDLPFDEMRRRLERARVVALPVRENSYSGATTVLAPGDGARQAGRRHADGGDRGRLRARGLATTCDSSHRESTTPSGPRSRSCSGTTRRARALGARARTTVAAELTWDRYAERLDSLVRAAAAGAARRVR